VGSEVIRRSRFDIHLSAGGGRLEAVWIGPAPGEAPTLVFLHEGLGCVALWRDFPARLANITGCGALVYSRLGYGGSDPCPLPRKLDFMDHEGLMVLPEVIRQCGIRDYLLVGHSDGGSIALIHAGGVPCPGLKGIVTLAAHVFCEDLTRHSIEAARERYLNGGLKTRLSSYHGDNTRCAFWGWNDVWLHPDFRQWTIEAFLPAIHVPVLAIQGIQDPYGSKDQVDVIQAKSGDGVVVEMIPDCGHAPHMEKTDALLATISAFIKHQINPTE
jgi:pimeloyl-ACP methyl ester carboxylesterase